MPEEGLETATRCAVIGDPVNRSLSPVLHRAAYAELGLDWSYDWVDLPADRLAGFLTGVVSPPWRGLSVTMPHKRAIIRYLDDVDELATRLDAVNTVLCETDGTRRGTNTDVGGFVAALAEAGVERLGAVTLLGGGATAGAALAAAAALGATTARCVVRDQARAAGLPARGERLGIAVTLERWDRLNDVRGGDVVISTIPPSAQAGRIEPRSLRWADLAPVLLDVGYVPSPTLFMTAAAAQGLAVIGGFSLLLHQAARQVVLMTGCGEAPLEAMRVAGLAELAARSSGR